MMGFLARMRGKATRGLAVDRYSVDGLGTSALAVRVSAAASLPAGSVLFETADGVKWAVHAGALRCVVTPFAAAPELGLRLDYCFDASGDGGRFALLLAAEADGLLATATVAAAMQDAVQGALQLGTLDLPPCTSDEEWHAFRAGVNELVYTRFGLVVEDCLPVDLHPVVDFAAQLAGAAIGHVQSAPADVFAPLTNTRGDGREEPWLDWACLADSPFHGWRAAAAAEAFTPATVAPHKAALFPGLAAAAQPTAVMSPGPTEAAWTTAATPMAAAAAQATSPMPSPGTAAASRAAIATQATAAMPKAAIPAASMAATGAQATATTPTAAATASRAATTAQATSLIPPAGPAAAAWAALANQTTAAMPKAATSAAARAATAAEAIAATPTVTTSAVPKAARGAQDSPVVSVAATVGGDAAKRDAAALRRLFLELPALAAGLRALPMQEGDGTFAPLQDILRRLALAALSVNTMPSLTQSAPGQRLPKHIQHLRAMHAHSAQSALDEGWAQLAAMRCAPDPARLEDLDRMLANLEYSLTQRRKPQP